MLSAPKPAAVVEDLGRWVGGLMAPVIGFVSSVRRARMFHPDGLVYVARVEPSEGGGRDLAAVAERLAGPAIVRLSSAWWRGEKEWLDVLGLAVRFVSPHCVGDSFPNDRDQDLLLATIRFPWTTPFAPITTRVSTFLWNHFHAVSPFEVEGLGRVKLRLRSPRIANPEARPRAEHLARAVAAGSAVYQLEARRLERPLYRRSWESIARVILERPIDIDQAALRFSPFRDGRGIRPVGFVHHLRASTYAASQQARPVANGNAGSGA